MVQRRQIGVVFTVEHDHIGRQRTKAPPGLGAQQRLHQTQAFTRMNAHQQYRFVPRNTQAPQLPLVDQWRSATSTGMGVGVSDVGSRAAVHQRGCEVLQRRIFVRVNAQVAQPHLGQCGGHARGAFKVHALQILVNAACQLGSVTRSGGGKAESGYPPSGNAHLDPQAGDRVQAVDGQGLLALPQSLRNGGLRAAAVAA